MPQNLIKLTTQFGNPNIKNSIDDGKWYNYVDNDVDDCVTMLILKIEISCQYPWQNVKIWMVVLSLTRARKPEGAPCRHLSLYNSHLYEWFR